MGGSGAIANAKNEAGLANLFDSLATMGINVVFLETVNASYPIFPSEVAPVQNPLLEGWDALASGVKLAHERGMELHAWTWIFAAANQRHNELMGQPQYYLGPVLTEHPDWATGDRRGDPFHARSRKAFFDPANPEVQNYLVELLTEIATKYDVDGIQFDYIRYPFQETSRNEVYGFGDAAREQFRLSGGYPDPITLEIGDRHWRKWQDFQVAQVDQFVKKATMSLRQVRPDLTLSAAVFPMPRDRRIEQIQQNWEAWIEAEYLDVLVPMTYAEDTVTLEGLTTDLLATFPSKSTLLVPSIRLLDIDSGIALDQRQHLRQLPTIGAAFFAASNLNPQLVTGLQTETSLLPHREPLAAIASRFETLQREWAITFTDQPWQNAAHRFEDRLTTAQNQPNPKAILLAQSQWEEFRLTFNPHLEIYAKQHPYQAQVWQYRLTVIEHLLSYGDRRYSPLP
ncbi:MAG: family 10 glycosylhydrolase [Limnothrix sp. RL_2_0]|nr:family 10 glycosylhydrolase [Limnothrix sp. RL_2_0]